MFILLPQSEHKECNATGVKGIFPLTCGGVSLWEFGEPTNPFHEQKWITIAIFRNSGAWEALQKHPWAA